MSLKKPEAPTVRQMMHAAGPLTVRSIKRLMRIKSFRSFCISITGRKLFTDSKTELPHTDTETERCRQATTERSSLILTGTATLRQNMQTAVRWAERITAIIPEIPFFCIHWKAASRSAIRISRRHPIRQNGNIIFPKGKERQTSGYSRCCRYPVQPRIMSWL